MPSARSNLGNSELAETRNWKAAVLPKPALPITLKKGDIVGKTGGDLSVWKGKGHSERRPRDSHLFLSGQACSSRPHLPLLRQLLRVWFPSAAAAEADAVCDPGVVRPCWPLLSCRAMFQVYLPSCMFVIVSWVSFMVKPEVVPGRSILNALKNQTQQNNNNAKTNFFRKPMNLLLWNWYSISVQNWSQIEKQTTD